MTRLNLALLAMLVAGGCSGGDVTAPSSSDLIPDAGATASRSSGESKMTTIQYEKWITTFPAMVGNVDGVLGAFTGTILQRIVSAADPKIIYLQARYVITDAHRKGHSFTAVVEGIQNLHTNTALLTGAVTEGWRAGAPVVVNFDVLSPCTVPTAPVGTKTCFKGIIRVGHARRGEPDRED
jgi:hypothetical protein